MKTINGISVLENKECFSVFVSVGELINKVTFAECNRCHYTDFEEGKKHGFTHKEIKATINRVNKTIKEVFDHGRKKWCISSPLILGGKFNTIIDAQGRFESYKKMLSKGEITEDELIPCLIYPNMTEDEVRAAIIISNIHRKNWDCCDTLHFYGEIGNEFTKNILAEIRDWSNEMSYTPKSLFVIMFGQGVSKIDNVVKCVKEKKVHPHKDELYRLVSQSYNGVMNNRNSMTECKKVIKMSNYIYVLDHFMTSIIEYHKCHNNVEVNSLIDELSKTIVNFCETPKAREIIRSCFEGGEKSIADNRRKFAKALIANGGTNGNSIRKTSPIYEVLVGESNGGYKKIQPTITKMTLNKVG